MALARPGPAADIAKRLIVDLDQNDFAARLMPVKAVAQRPQRVLGDLAGADQAENQPSDRRPQKQLPWRHFGLGFRALRHLGVELHLVTKDSLAPEPGVFVYNNLQANSQPLKDLYHACDVFALPTYGDCLPMVLSEAGAAEMAIVSTSVAGIPEIILNRETGLTVPVGDAGALTQALSDLATNPALRLSLGKRALAHVTRHYDAPTNASLLLNLLKAEANATHAERTVSTSRNGS